MHAIKYLSILPSLISLCVAADCYGSTRDENAIGAAKLALDNLRYIDGQNRGCVEEGGKLCKACYRTGGKPARFYEAIGNIRDQCATKDRQQGYWEADGLRVCYDCVNSGNCNGDTM